MSTVKFIATNRAAKKFPVIMLAAIDGNTAYTGQHIDPNDDSTKDNLTMQQMLGKVPLTEVQRSKFGFVINPEEYYQVYSGQSFDTDSQKDSALMRFAVLQKKIAPSKSEFEKNRKEWLGYFENKEVEADDDVKRDDLVFEAGMMVKSASQEKIVDLGLLADYLIPTANIDIKTFSPTRIRAELYKLCKTDAEKIIQFFNPEAKEDIFVLNLCRFKILTKNATGFYDGTKYLGTSLQSVRDFRNKKENAAAVDRWARQLLEAKGIVDKVISPTEEQERFINDAKICIADDKFDDALKLLSKVKVPQLQEQVEKLRDKISDGLSKKAQDTPLDLNNLTDAQKDFYEQIKGMEQPDLVSLATTKKIGKKSEIGELTTDQLIEKLLKTVK